MALLAISGKTASQYDEVARATAQLLKFDLVTEDRLTRWIVEEFGDAEISKGDWKHAAVSVLARIATAHHLVLAVAGAEELFSVDSIPQLRIEVRLPEAARIGRIMVDRRLERGDAKAVLADLDRAAGQLHKERFGRTRAKTELFDLILNGEQWDTPQLAEVIRTAAAARGLCELGLLSQESEAQIRFEANLKLARHGILPAGRAELQRTRFNHPSEQVFANLLDFYRIAWEYEPRSFPLQWDKDGKVTEAFTPDFYLPEFDRYVELTTMKQSLVTRKNRKVKLLKAIYPHVNIQIFYQKDFQNLVFKHGLQFGPKDSGA